MTLVVAFHPEAREELLEAHDWYVKRSAPAGDAFFVEIDRVIALLAQTPYTWPLHLDDTRRCLLRRFPYSVIYRVEGNRIEIVAVAHQKRRPGYWRGR